MIAHRQRKKILVTGATGHQGRALIHALYTSLSGKSGEDFHVLAMTRTLESPTAQQLASHYPGCITLVQGDLDDAESVQRVFQDAKEEKDGSGGGIWGVFCVLAYPGQGVNADGEEKQGKTMADMALKNGVSCFVYSSNERAGEYNDDNATLSYRAKVMIERHIKELGKKGLPWTILRPGFFMENFEGFIGSITVGVLKNGLKPTTTVRVVAVEDIGCVAAAVFNNPVRYHSKILVVSGEVTTIGQQEEAYRKATGKALPSIPWLFSRAIIAMNVHTRDLLVDLERMHLARETGLCPETVSQNADAKRAHPGMKTFETWAQSRGTHTIARKEGWNQVSLFGLITGQL